VRATRSFTVRVRLPAPLAPIEELARNLRWSWDERARDLFRWIDAEAWDASGHDPAAMLGLVRPERLAALASDPAFLAFMAEVHAELRRQLDAPSWTALRAESRLRAVAYFSPEFGISEALPQYSGGLGVLAGDHLKAASALALPLVGVGLFYRSGYFRQRLRADGWQDETYPRLDPHAMALDGPASSRVELDLAGRPLVAQIWTAHVGRIRLHLLDTDVDDNDPDGRAVTDRLYGGDIEHRLRQEILLGMGGVRLLELLGEETQVFHTNEGHAGFLGLELAHRLVTKEGLRFAEALEVVRASCVFTTHTPVPAGIDQFPVELMARYFTTWADEVGIGLSGLLDLGHRPGEDPEAPFNMAVMGLRLAGQANGVSRLHGATSRRLFASLWPDLEPDDVPISSVTNGVHGLTWVSPEMGDVFQRAVLPTWSQAPPAAWAGIEAVPDDQLWRVRELGRQRLVAMVRERLRASLEAQGVPAAERAWAEEVLDGRVLTVVFARRFATYKRATLLLSDPERLKALLLSPDRPVQLVFAGKAHPADEAGKDLIRAIVAFSRQTDVRHRIAFVEDYDIAVARTLYQGADVWLNTPRRPMEACGTSGMKAALNGALNCSILDGWWDELANGENGWAIPSAEGVLDEDRRDALEAAELFDLLEREIVPLFYDRFGGGVPRRWIARVKASLRTLGPVVMASRMVREYAERHYEPAAARRERLSAEGFARAKALAAWKARVRAGWPEVCVESVDGLGDDYELGTRRAVEVEVCLGPLEPSDVTVELLHGPVGPNDDLLPAGSVAMVPVTASVPAGNPLPAGEHPADGGPPGPVPAGGGHAGEQSRPPSASTSPSPRAASGPRVRYHAAFDCVRPGRYGFAVRVLPTHPDLAHPMELGLVAWG